MRRPVRLIDSGVRPTSWQLAMSAALIELHRAGAAADTLRFQRFPRAAIIGRHQVLAREVDLAWCRAEGVEVARRITGGGAIVMAPEILGWELILPAALFERDLAVAVQRICTAAAAGLSALGITARFRPRNDIEVGGRKLCGTGGYFDGPSLLYQGTVLVRLDRPLLRRALRWPGEKLARHGAAEIEARVTDLETLLGQPVAMAAVQAALADGLARGLGLELAPATLTAEEEGLAARLLAEEIGTAAFIAGDSLATAATALEASHRAAGATLQALVLLRPGAGQIIERALLHGDFFVTPPRVIADLEAHLQDLPLADAPARAEAFLAAAGARLLGATPADFAVLLGQVVARPPTE
jgi:lipoate-protein ligase A